MSRARSLLLPENMHPLFEADPAFEGGRYWLDMLRNGEAASSSQLELLAVVEDVDLDDLLDTVLTQAEVLRRLRIALDQGPVPTEVLIRRERWRQARQALPRCRKCEKAGDSTKHHFVNKWILRELPDYAQKWADRSKNCIPVCIDCHRHLHIRDDEAKTIVDYLTLEEREFANAALTALSEQRPKLLILIARGDDGTYETRLVRDWIEGRLAEQAIPPRHLAAIS